MSEKNWTCKWTGSGRRGRKHRGKEYPRHTLQYYDGTHLSMGKHIWSKSQLHSVWREGEPAILSKYIIGLCNKYVGKPYSELKKAYDKKIKPFKKYYIRWNTLDDFVYNEPRENSWRQSFYIDANGIVCKCKMKPRHQHTLSKKQWNFNKKVKVPDFGQVRQDRRHATSKYQWGNHYTETGFNDVPHNFEIPLLLGEFWVNYENRIFKIPIYTCCSDMFRDYKRYRGWQWNKGKEYFVPFHEGSIWRKKALKIEKEWIPISVYGLADGQSHILRLPNHSLEEIKGNITYWNKRILEIPSEQEKERLRNVIQDAYNKMENMPETLTYDMGYGKYYTFMKRSDYDNFIKSITKQT